MNHKKYAHPLWSLRSDSTGVFAARSDKEESEKHEESESELDECMEHPADCECSECCGDSPMLNQPSEKAVDALLEDMGLELQPGDQVMLMISGSVRKASVVSGDDANGYTVDDGLMLVDNVSPLFLRRAQAAAGDPIAQFMQGLKGQTGPARGAYITSHLNNPQFVAALQVHPQGKQLSKQLWDYVNSRSNATAQGAGAKVKVAQAAPQEPAPSAPQASPTPKAAPPPPPRVNEQDAAHAASSRLLYIRGEVCKALRAGAGRAELDALLKAEAAASAEFRSAVSGSSGR